MLCRSGNLCTWAAWWLVQQGRTCIRACSRLLVLMLHISGRLLMCDLQQRHLLSVSGTARPGDAHRVCIARSAHHYITSHYITTSRSPTDTDAHRGAPFIQEQSHAQALTCTRALHALACSLSVRRAPLPPLEVHWAACCPEQSAVMAWAALACLLDC